MEAGIRRHLSRREADVAYGHRQGLAAAPWGAEQGLLGHLAEGSDNRHVGTFGGGGNVFTLLSDICTVKFHRRQLNPVCQFVFFLLRSRKKKSIENHSR